MDHRAASRAAVQGIFAHYRSLFGEMGFDEVYAEWVGINGRYWHQYAAGTLSPEELRGGRMGALNAWAAARTGTAADPELADELNRSYLEMLAAATSPCDGVIPMLEALHGGVPLGIISNGFADIQRARLGSSGLGRFFDHVIISEEVGARKPDLRIFRAALDAAGTLPGETLYIGDTFLYDICGASLAGLRTIWLDTGPGDQPTSFPEIRPDAVARSIPDLAALLGVSPDLSPSI